MVDIRILPGKQAAQHPALRHLQTGNRQQFRSRGKLSQRAFTKAEKQRQVKGPLQDAVGFQWRYLPVTVNLIHWRQFIISF